MAEETREEMEAKAKGRFVMISLMRLGGALMVVAGLAVQMNVLPLPMWTAYLLMGLGLLELFVVPRLLAGIWSSNDKLPPQP